MHIKRAIFGILIILFILLCFNGYKYGSTNPGITIENGTKIYKYGMYDVIGEKVGQDFQNIIGITVNKIESHEIEFSIFNPVVLFIITHPLDMFGLIIESAILYFIIDIIVFHFLLSKRKQDKE